MKKGKVLQRLTAWLLAVVLVMMATGTSAWADEVSDESGELEQEQMSEDVKNEESKESEVNTGTGGAGTGLTDGWYPGTGRSVRTGGEDVTAYIEFTPPILTTSSGTIIEEGNDIIFTNTSYKFSIDWSVDFTALSNAGLTLGGGDYFTFTVPTMYGNRSFNIYSNTGKLLGVLTINNGAGKITFEDTVAGMTAVSGEISMTASYSSISTGEPVTWTFVFGDTYTYTGSSAGGATGNGVGETTNNYKSGSMSGTDNSSYYWDIYLNMQQASWNSTVTLTDTLGDGHKMRNTLLSVASYLKQYGFYGLTDFKDVNVFGTASDARYYFAISVVDWNTMRAEYNKFIEWSNKENKATLWVDRYGDGNYEETKYELTKQIDSGYTSYMRSVMQTWTDKNGDYVYISPYTGGLESVEASDGGFTLVFPAGALDGKSLRINYYTEVSKIAPATISNSYQTTGENVTYTKEQTTTVTVSIRATISGVRGELILYKYDSGGRTALSDASFQLEESGLQYDETKVTNGSGVAVFDLISSGGNGYSGTYVLTETIAPSGYAKPGDSIILEIDADGEITKVNDTTIPTGNTDGTFVYDSEENRICQVSSDRLVLIVYNYETATGKISLTAKKQWADTVGIALEDGQFTFEVKENGDVVATGSNDAAGEIIFTDIAYDSSDVGEHTYQITEQTGTNTGILYSDTAYEVKVQVSDAGGGTLSAEVTSVNGQAPGTQEIVFTNDTTKVEILKVDETGSALSGAKLELYDADGSLVEAWTSTAKAHVLEGKLEPGATYTLKETKAPDGYLLASDVTFTANSDGKILKVSMTDKKRDEQYSVKVTKYVKMDDVYRSMSYSFYAALFWDADCTQRASEVLELKLEKTYVTTGVFKGLTAGTYYLAETDAEGNALDLSDPGAVFTNEITEEVITLTPKQASQSTEITNHLLNPPEGNLYEDDGAIEIDKSVAAGEKAKAVTDTFYFTLYSDEEMTHVVETKSLSLKEASAGKVVFDALAYGTYYIAETDAEGNPVDDSFGYDVTVSDEEIKLEDGNTVTVKIVNDLGDEETPDKKPKSDPKDNTSSKKSKSPQTGDNSQMMLYLILLAGAAMIITSVMVSRKKVKIDS